MLIQPIPLLRIGDDDRPRGVLEPRDELAARALGASLGLPAELAGEPGRQPEGQAGRDLGPRREGLDPDIAADAVLALCNGAAASLSRRKSVDPRKAAPMWVDIFLDGTRKREG